MVERISRKAYLVWGFSLILFKYFAELAFYFLAKSTLLSPISFLSPFLYTRSPMFSTLPDWFGPMIILWSLPTIWISAGMSIRRAADASLSPWLGIIFIIPALNYILIFALSILPTSSNTLWG